MEQNRHHVVMEGDQQHKHGSLQKSQAGGMDLEFELTMKLIQDAGRFLLLPESLEKKKAQC